MLVVAAGLGFGLGALTYEPPAPELDVPQTAEPAPTTSTPPASGAVVPDLVGLGRNAASARLDELGVLYVVAPLKGRDDDRVARQTPGPGSPIRPATSVLLQVRCDPKPCPPPPEGKQLYDPCSCSWR